MAIDGKLINRIFFDASGNQKKTTEIQVNEILLINPEPKQSTKVAEIPFGKSEQNIHKKAS